MLLVPSAGWVPDGNLVSHSSHSEAREVRSPLSTLLLCLPGTLAIVARSRYFHAVRDEGGCQRSGARAIAVARKRVRTQLHWAHDSKSLTARNLQQPMGSVLVADDLQGINSEIAGPAQCQK